MSDLISRQDAIDAVEARIKWFNGDAIEDRCKRDAFIQVIDEILTELPSADSMEVECYVNGQMVVRGVPDGYLRDDIEGVIVYSDSFCKHFEVVR